MKLVRNWRVVLLRAWSVRFVILAALADAVTQFAPTALPLVPPEWVGMLVIALLVAAVVSRVVQQMGVTNAD